MVVVRCSTCYQVCEISEINASLGGYTKPIAWVIDHITLQPYKEALERETSLIKMREHIEEEKKRLESMVTYELIAEKNPEFKDMLEKFKSLGGSI